MNDREWDIYKDGIEKHFNSNDIRLNSHSQRLDKIEQESVRLSTKTESLIDKMDGLTKTLWWFIGLQIASYVGFFFYMVQNKLT